jgi:hypothetical protein
VINNYISSLFKVVFSAIFGACLFISSANAILIDNGTITLDSDTGIEWLDLTESINRSYDDVAGQFGTGGDFAGWRHANFTEVSTLFANGGFAAPYFANGISFELFEMLSLLGATRIEEIGDSIVADAGGMFDDTGIGTDPIRQGFALFSATSVPSNTLFSFEFAEITPDGAPSNFSDPNVGHWLVRDGVLSIPEPGMAVLFGGAALLLLRRR